MLNWLLSITFLYIAIINVGPRASSTKGIARMFGVHHQNVVATILR
jgi:hypothetical protein